MEETLKTQQIFNIIDENLLNELLEEYNNGTPYEKNLMNKIIPKDSTNKTICKIVEKITNLNLECNSGNFYKHKHPYSPHTDYKTWLKNTINVVIPIKNDGGFAGLVVFDQIYPYDSIDWSMNKQPIELTFNTSVKGCPYEYPAVKRLTNKDIDDELYKHVNRYPKECFFGLSGQVLPFEIGSIMIMDNRHIHMTTNMSGEKLGLSLRFKVI